MFTALLLRCVVGAHRVAGVPSRVHAILGRHPRGNRRGVAHERQVSREHDQGSRGQGRCGRFGEREENPLPRCRSRIKTPPCLRFD